MMLILSNKDAHAVRALIKDVERKIQLARTSIHANTERGKATLKAREEQLDVLQRVLKAAY